MRRLTIVVVLAAAAVLASLLSLFWAWENPADGPDCDGLGLSVDGSAGNEQALFDAAPFITT